MSKVSKNTKSKHTNVNVKSAGYLNLFKVGLLAILLFVIFYIPYLRGLYFEPEQFVTQIILFSIFILFWIYKWLRNDKVFLRTKIEYAVFGFMIIYLLSSFTAVSQRLAVSEFLKYAMYFVVFIMISDLIKTEKEKAIVLWVIVLSALGVCIIGIDSMAKGTIVNILNSVFKALKLNVEFFGLFVDGRIHSTMQYPNALASYLLAVFFVSISLTITSSKWIGSFSNAINYVLLTTFVFTISRGAYILFIFAGIVFLVLLPKERKIKGLYYILTVGIITVPLSFIISKCVFGDLSKIYIWPIVICGALVNFFIRYIDSYVTKILNKVNLKVLTISAVSFIAILTCIFPFIYNASIPLEIKHSIDEKESYLGVNKLISLKSNKTYKLVFNVEGQSINDEASYVYRIYMLGVDKIGSESNSEILVNEQYGSTNGIEEKEIEFKVPENIKVVSIYFQSYYPGTSVSFHNAKIYDVESGKKVKDFILKHKYSFVESIFSRFENIKYDKSFITRITFVKDGIKIFKDWWLIGAGGGAWSILNFKYQSYLYWSTQTHNYPLQVLIETGLLGFMIFLILLVSIVLSFIKLYKRYNSENVNEGVVSTALFTAIMFLFLHSVLDFDFSLSSIYLLVWELVALLNIDLRKCLSKEVNVKKKSKIENRSIYGILMNVRDKLKVGINAYPVIIIVVSFIVLSYPIKFYTAYFYSNKAIKYYNSNQLDKAIKLMEKAANTDKLKTEFVTGYTPTLSNPNIKLGYIDLVIKKVQLKSGQSEESENLNEYIVKAQEFAKRVEKHAKYDSELALNLGIYYLNTAEKDKGVDFINKSVDLRPLVTSQWQFKANANYATSLYYIQKGEHEKGLEYLNNVLKMIDEAATVNKSNLSPFIFNTATQEYIEKAYLLKNSIEDGITDIDNFVFQSIFEMDVNNNNMPDQWNASDKSLINVNLENGVFSVERNDINKNPCIYTRDLVLEPEKEYLIEVELSNYQDITSIPYQVYGISDKIDKMYFNNNVYSAKFVTPTEIGDKNQFRLYIQGNYKIKSVRILGL